MLTIVNKVIYGKVIYSTIVISLVKASEKIYASPTRCDNVSIFLNSQLVVMSGVSRGLEIGKIVLFFCNILTSLKHLN